MSVASAQDVAVPLPPPLPTETEYAGPTIGITFSPIHLVFPVVELAVEVRAAPKMGVVVLGGVGKITPENATDAYSVWEAGAQFRYYAVGDFRHGMQLGAEALYVNVSDTAQNITITANGLAAGPFTATSTRPRSASPSICRAASSFSSLARTTTRATRLAKRLSYRSSTPTSAGLFSQSPYDVTIPF